MITGHDIGLVGFGLFMGYYLYIALNYREVMRARRSAPRRESRSSGPRLKSHGGKPCDCTHGDTDLRYHEARPEDGYL